MPGGEPGRRSQALQHLGLAAVYAGDLDAANTAFDRSLRSARQAGGPGAAEAMCDGTGMAPLTVTRPWAHHTLAQARTALPADRLDRAWRTGRSATPAAAVAAAHHEAEDDE